MKLILLGSLLLFSLRALASGIDDAETFKKNPAQRPLISEYWDAFHRGQEVKGISGAQIAANMVIEEKEEALKEAGFRPDEIDQLRSEAQVIYDLELAILQKKAQARREKEEIFPLLENIDVASPEEIRSQLQIYVTKNPRWRSVFEWANNSSTFTNSPSLFRFNAGLLLLSTLQADGYNFSTPSGERSVDATLRAFRETLIYKRPVFEYVFMTNHLSMPDHDTLIKRWKKLIPISRWKAALDILRNPVTILGGMSLMGLKILLWKASYFDELPLLGLLVAAVSMNPSPRKIGLTKLRLTRCRLGLQRLLSKHGTPLNIY